MTHHLPGQPIPMLSMRKFFLKSYLNLTVCSLRLCSLVFSLAASHLATISFQVVVESDKTALSLIIQLNNHSSFNHSSYDFISPDASPASLPISRHAPDPQCLPGIEGPRTGHRFQCVASPVPGTGGQSVPCSCGHTVSDTGQDATVILPTWAQLAHVQLLLTSSPSSFSTLPQPAALQWVAVIQGQGLALCHTEHSTELGPRIQPAQVPLQSLPALQQINNLTQRRTVCKLTEDALDPLVHITGKDMKTELAPREPLLTSCQLDKQHSLPPSGHGHPALTQLRVYLLPLSPGECHG
ncbi:uncharacterized protein LOC128809059 [Vidua macroura]|uniref:uncharacterized protein LOC128809059 n=1 Tax=Vidua macroura TaxID=187451 RepID=UPI0023A8D3FA|nr:uncharacterized protein LOC128809059 [Vidua macroura]